jgi:mannosyltransferase OCH1-like enzyme
MIPKIIHQLWIGPKGAPTKFMDSWRDKHPEYEYIRWSESVIKERGLHLSCTDKINDMEEINGKADIIRWEILYHYGGIFLDADSICIEPLNEIITDCKAFAIWENEQCRQGLVAPGAMGFPPKHPLVRACIEWIQQNDVNVKRTGKRAWKTVGPGLLTQMYQTGKYPDMTILPSYYFLPQHYSGLEYRGHARIFSHQEWGSTKNHYDKMNSIELPTRFLPPSPVSEKSVSILVSSFNTNIKYVQQCLESIKHQVGNFHMELVWINDGSDGLSTQLLKRALEHFERSTRFTKVVYKENNENMGIGYTLYHGIEMCSHEIIVKMDSDDIMVPTRIQQQMDYLREHPKVQICGGQISMFRDAPDGKQQDTGKSNHPSITWDEYKAKPNHWFMNHPTACYRKSGILLAGNYDPTLRQMAEDFELELRMLKKHGFVFNTKEVLVRYRLHDGQVTHKGGKEGPSYWNEVRNKIIQKMMV